MKPVRPIFMYLDQHFFIASDTRRILAINPGLLQSLYQRVLNDLLRTKSYDSETRSTSSPSPVSKFSLFLSLPVCPR
jgi:hypothetical protein